MAPRLHHLQIAALIGLLALSVSAAARPCRTFLISSYSFSLPTSDSHHTPTFATFTEIRSFFPLYVVPNNDGNNEKSSFATEIFFDRALPVRDSLRIERSASQPRAPFGFSTYDFTSLRDRTKDILSVVVALLFGVGCGALTAATMYLVWSVFSNRHDYGAASYDDDDFSDEGELESPKKKGGYVKIPAAEAAPAPAPAPTKEAV